MKKRRVIVIGCIVAALGLVGSWWALQRAMDGQYKICSIKSPANNGTFEIFTDNFGEISAPLYFELRVAGQTRVPMTYFCSVPYEMRVEAQSFLLRAGQKGELVGIALASEPHMILIMHDFETNENWPRGGDRERSEATQKRGVAMLERLKREAANNELKLASEYSRSASFMNSSAK